MLYYNSICGHSNLAYDLAICGDSRNASVLKVGKVDNVFSCFYGDNDSICVFLYVSDEVAKEISL